MKNMTLRGKIVGMVFVAVFFPLIITGGYLFITQNVDPRDGLAKILVANGNSAAKLMDNFITSRATEIQLVGGSSTLRSTPDQASYGLERYLKNFSEYDSLIFVDTAGQVVAHQGNILLSKGESDLTVAVRRWLQEVQKGTKIVDSIPEPGNFERYLVFTVPVQHNGTNYGWVFGQVNSEKIAKFSIDVEIGETGRATLFNGDGILIGHKDKSRYGGNMSNYPIMSDPINRGVDHPGDFFLSGDGRTKWGMTLLLTDTLEKYGLKWGIIVDQTEHEMFAPNRKMRNSIIGITVFCLVLFIPLGFWIVNRWITLPLINITKGLSDGAEQVSSSSGQIAGGSQSLADGASRQAASLEETSASLEEISAMTKQNADNSRAADSLMKETGTVVQKASLAMAELTTSMAEISKASEETQKIVKTIDEIAFQTNLLALNAAVEAARAGEAGAGFAVVADEVRNLAMRAADAAKNTASLIEETVKKVKGGAEIVAHSNETFSEVSTNTQKASQLITEIAGASREQSDGLDQLNKAMNEMDGVVQTVAANSEESAASAEELNAMAEQLTGLVNDLSVLVGGNIIHHQIQKPAPKKAEPKAKGPAKKQELKPAPKKAVPKKLTPPKKKKPEEAIPFDDDDFQDF